MAKVDSLGPRMVEVNPPTEVDTPSLQVNSIEATPINIEVEDSLMHVPYLEVSTLVENINRK